MRKVLFLDRDGVINVDFGHVYEIKNFVFLPEIFDLCKFFLKLGYEIIVITNQAGISKKIYSFYDFEYLNMYMLDKFREQNIEILDVKYCQHQESDGCECRKPKPGMIIDAIKDYAIDIKSSILIGDKMSDIDAGHSAGIDSLYFLIGGYPYEDRNFDYKKIYNLNDIIKELK